MLNNPPQSTYALRKPLEYSKFGLHTIHKMFCISSFSYFKCWSGAQGTEIHKQLRNGPSPTLSLHHNHAALRWLWTRSRWQELLSRAPPETQGTGWARSLHRQDWLSDYIWPQDLSGKESLRKYWEVGWVEKYIVGNSYSLDSRKKSGSVWNFWVSS